MNRNTESRFDLAPQVAIQRSTFDRSHSLKTSFNVGEVVPVFCEEVLPGDTFKVKTAFVGRLQTLLTPIMDNMHIDFYFGFCPNRLVWSHFQNLMGENTESAWVSQTEYSIPQVTAPSGGWDVGSLADYFGIPTGIDGFSVNALPFRAYALFMDQWFRDQNNQDPVLIDTGDSTTYGSNGSNYITDLVKGGKPFVACKSHDYFTSALPAPQKGQEVVVPIIEQTANPVYTSGGPNRFYARDTMLGYNSNIQNQIPMLMDDGDNNTNSPFPSVFHGEHLAGHYFLQNSPSTNYRTYLDGKTSDDKTLVNVPISDYSVSKPLLPVNLVTDVRGGLTSINTLRQAFQIQRLYEKDARGGTRYIEILRSHFGVTSPDSRLQRVEYLGGHRFPLNISQITNQNGDGDVALGDVAGQSVTANVEFDFNKSFVEHGYVIGVAVVRYDHTYQQGLAKMWTRKSRFDFYWPALAHLGEMPVYNREIFLSGDTGTEGATDDEAFGYQEAWAEYRYHPNMITGEMRSDASNSLDTWHLGDDYAQLPTLSAGWIAEDAANVDRVLAVTSSVANQVFADFYFKNTATRPMPLYSIPGLIDHF